MTIMSTYNSLSVPTFDKLVYEVYNLKKIYGSSQRYWNSGYF